MLVQIRSQDLAGKSVQRPDVQDVGEVEVVLLESLTYYRWSAASETATSKHHARKSEQFLWHGSAQNWIILWNWTDIHGKFSAAFVVFSSMLHLDLQIVCSTDLVWTIDVSVFECRHQSCFFCISWAIEIEKTINWPSRSWLSYRTLQDRNGLLPLSESYQKNPHADFATSAVVTISWYLALSAIRAVSQGRGKKGLPGWFEALFVPCCPGV